MNDLRPLFNGRGLECEESGVCGEVLGEPCRFYVLSGADIVDAWHLVREHVPDGWPLVLPEDFNEGKLFTANPETVSADLQHSEAFDVPQWFRDGQADYDFDNEDDELAEMLEEFGESAPEFDNPEPQQTFSLPYRRIHSEFEDRLWLCVVPKIPFYHLPVYLQSGGWNACPYPHEQAAVMKYWHGKYGAELFGMNDDTIEMWVTKPPETEEDAFELAKEQMVFCDDIVFQGTMTVERLAKGLVNSRVWYFWWD